MNINLASLLVTVIIIAAVIAITSIAIKAFGLVIPDWVIQIFWVVVVAFVAIFAIRFVLTF